MKKSHELIQLEICERRGIILDKEMESRLYNLRKGFKGESTVYQWFQKYSKQKIHIINDYWFYHGKNMQVDLLIILENRWIVVEVKNYYGYFEYREYECYLNGQLMSDNHFNQLAHRTQRLQHIANELNSNIKVESIMVFIDEHCDVYIESEISTKVIQRHQLKFYIESITNSEQQSGRVPYINQIAGHLEKYKIASPFQPKLISDALEYNALRTGINCAKCQSYYISIAYQSVRCHDCGHREYKKLVVSRLAVELCYIHYYHPEKITTKAIHELCGRGISKRIIRKVMSNQYPRIGRGANTYYDIKLD